ncbi:MAG: rhodanese-like domain-containing protein [Actinomycetia bacterium]|nr:rhodanese-like domain-containing protein [Actinomycetes bacterium]
MNVILGILALAFVGWQVGPALRARWVSAAWLAERLDRGDPVIVADIRSREDYDRGHIRQAVSAPHTRVRQYAGIWPKDAVIVLVARSGYREVQAWQWLRRRGFARVYCLKGGMIGWVLARLDAAEAAGATDAAAE